ncbi:TPA: hypothetical protein PCG80_004466 [Klebsiella pneumoniae]|uniref:hypothetical protein n=1 Tax=Klebsiella michiganensis TaxID=1134687 RepID=UPI0007CD2932|nr:hypothetical protein [Klebsiella michiganensis]SBL97047.1 Uncharacterised protein [Klebsiella michiganensis]HDE1654264.1 hypothetical protein [Klebsiella pneumoniae]HDE2612497.1 hypothetical protein [Klebsiella pneumoniae]
MPRNNVPLLAFNRGIISPLALARTDIERLALSAEVQTNWMPRLLGSMMLRPGLGYIGQTLDNKRSRFIPFVFATDDTALIELTDGKMRVWVDDVLVSRSAVSSVITNGGFESDLSGWTDADESDSSSEWTDAGMQLTGNSSTSAIRWQQVSVSASDQDVQHAIRVSVARGPVTIMIGSSQGEDDYIAETTLLEGVSSLSFTPAGDFYIQFESAETFPVIVGSVAVESGGVLVLDTPWRDSDLDLVQVAQSADVLFVACSGIQQRRIERRDNGSWSVVKYYSNDGPYNVMNVSPTTLTPGARTGLINLTASASLFRSGHVGALFRLTSSGQTVSSAINGESQFTGYVKVTGIDDSRKFTVSIANVDPATPWSGTVTLQRSVSEPGAWTDVKTWTGETSETYDDGLDNNTIYYRIGVAAGDWETSSGSVQVSLEYSGGSLTGTVRITAVNSRTSATGIVLSDLGGTSATADWYEGAFSAKNGFPGAVAIFEGRLWWAGGDRIYGSYSDAYDSFDDGNNSEDKVAGDASAINYSIGSGPVDKVNWLLPLLRLIAGTQGSEASIQSSSYGEVVTPDNFHIKYPSTRGSTHAGAVVLDNRGIFIHRSGRRVYELNYTSDYYDYASTDLTDLWPECGNSPIVRISAQRLPDDRIHCVRENGTVAVLVRDPAEDLKAWVVVETDGTVEDVVTLPGDEEDRVYYVVNRNGIRCLERWAKESECIGGSLNKQADSFITRSGSARDTLSGLNHIEGKAVVVWADGKDIGTRTVSSGAISLGASYSNVIAGLGYTAKYKSSKLAYAAGMGTALAQRKRVDHLALIMRNTHYRGMTYGPDFDIQDDLPAEEFANPTSSNTVWESYDRDSFEFDGSWDTDSRICLIAAAPRPVTVLAAIVSLTTHDK